MGPDGSVIAQLIDRVQETRGLTPTAPSVEGEETFELDQPEN